MSHETMTWHSMALAQGHPVQVRKSKQRGQAPVTTCIAKQGPPAIRLLQMYILQLLRLNARPSLTFSDDTMHPTSCDISALAVKTVTLVLNKGAKM